MLLTTGSKFGKWVVRHKATDGKYLCVCACGTEAEVPGTNLTKGRSTQCKRCQNTKLEASESAFNKVYLSYVHSAKSRGLDWIFTKAEARMIFERPCFFCKRPPFAIRTARNCRGSFTFSGIDRLDSSLGYVRGNCVPCCKDCNYMKRDLPLVEFKEHISRIAIGLGLCELNPDAEGADTQNSDTRFP